MADYMDGVRHYVLYRDRMQVLEVRFDEDGELAGVDIETPSRSRGGKFHSVTLDYHEPPRSGDFCSCEKFKYRVGSDACHHIAAAVMFMAKEGQEAIV